MAQVANFGSVIVFEVSDRKIFTFSNMKKTVSAQWAEHSRIGQKPQLEFAGASLATITFQITLNALLGVKPRTTLENIEAAIENGQVETFVVGGKKIGKGQWCIKDISETWDEMYNDGSLVAATASITMQEYF